MNVKRIKKICMVKGCSEKDTFALSVSEEWGMSVIICAQCLKKANEAILKLGKDNVYKEAVAEKAAPPLFYHPKPVVKTEEAEKTENAFSVAETEELPAESAVEEAKTEAGEKFCCPKCGKVYKSESAFQKHILTCKG